jgi:hypothetical protein
MPGTDPPSRLSLAELLADLSLVTDLGMGNEPETAARTCLLATRLARGVGLTEEVVADVFYTALLLHLGCTASAHEAAAAYGGDDIAVNASGARTDLTAPAQILTTWLPGVLQGLPLHTKLQAGTTALVRGGRVGAMLQRANCEVAAGTARRLGLSAGVQEAIGQAFESWNGKGRQRMAGEAIAVAMRVAQVAALAALFDRLGGPESAVASSRAAAAEFSTRGSPPRSSGWARTCSPRWPASTCVRRWSRPSRSHAAGWENRSWTALLLPSATWPT